MRVKQSGVVGCRLSVVGKSQGVERFFQQPRTNNRQPSAKGFTLIEVLVGVLVLALALMALTRTAAIQVQAFGDLRERTLAGWLAADVLAETRLANPFPPTGKSDGQRKFAGRDWHWQLNVEATDVATMRRLNVYVYTSAESTAPVAALVGFGGTDLMP